MRIVKIALFLGFILTISIGPVLGLWCYLGWLGDSDWRRR